VTGPYIPSDAANEGSDYFNALPIEERQKLAPLLEHYRQMGLAEAYEEMHALAQRTRNRIDARHDPSSSTQRPLFEGALPVTCARLGGARPDRRQ
jgi:hypothetical protein